MILYDLALADPEIRPSPFCWLVKLALRHKGLDFETVPLRFKEKENYPDPEHGKLPILVSGEETIVDSAHIIAWLERTHTDNPFYASEGERSAGAFFQAWSDRYLFPALFPMVSVHVWAAAHEDDKEYYRQSREARFEQTLEELAATTGQKDSVEKVLKPLSAPLARHKFLGGGEPNLTDYIVFAPFLWERIVCPQSIYQAPQPIEAWRERMLDLFDGYGRNAKRVE